MYANVISPLTYNDGGQLDVNVNRLRARAKKNVPGIRRRLRCKLSHIGAPKLQDIKDYWEMSGRMMKNEPELSFVLKIAPFGIIEEQMKRGGGAPRPQC